jgi:hypothetical protein
MLHGTEHFTPLVNGLRVKYLAEKRQGKSASNQPPPFYEETDTSLKEFRRENNPLEKFSGIPRRNEIRK